MASQQILGLSCANSGYTLFEQGILPLPWVVESCFASLSFFLTDYRALALGRPLKKKQSRSSAWVLQEMQACSFDTFDIAKSCQGPVESPGPLGD